MGSKDSFVFHLENKEDLEVLSTEQVGLMFLAMIHYAETEEEPGFTDPLMQAVWKPIRRRLKFDMDSYAERSRINKENGSKGGAPKGNKNAKKQPKTTENNQKQPKTTLSDTDTDTDTISESVSESDSDSDSDSFSFFSAAAPAEKEKKESEPFMNPDVDLRFAKFKAMREEKGRGMNADSEQIVKEKIVKFSKGDPSIAAQIIDQAIEGGYMTVIPLQKPPEQKARSGTSAEFAQHDYDFAELTRRAKA